MCRSDDVGGAFCCPAADVGETTTKRQTIAEARYPHTPEFLTLAEQWRADASVVLLRHIWSAYDLLIRDVFSGIDLRDADEDLERSITQLLEPRIDIVMSGDEPFYIQHGPFEHETRLPPPAQPPQYDLAFILYANPRIMWPIEAKILRTVRSVATYATSIRDQFVTCRYSPFSAEAAMLGYLLTGDARDVFTNIATEVPCELEEHPDFPDRPHRVSRHRRSVPAGKTYPGFLRCHHLILRVSPQNTTRPVAQQCEWDCRLG